nr:murein biosynthesis integral membrane protein MurJ [Jeotgalibacillus malaysiensis]
MKNKLGIASLLLILATIFLKVSGLARDITLAYFFGDSLEAGAYLAAFVIPNTIILFLNNGMKNALVPTYIAAQEKKGEKHHLSQVMLGTILISLIISIAGAALAPFYIPLMYDFSGEALHIATIVTIIFFSSMVGVGMNAVLEGYFDAVERFAISVTSQTIVTLSSILFAILFANSWGVYSLAIGYAAGVVISLVLKLLFFIQKGTFSIRQKLDYDEIKTFFIIFIPVGLTIMVGQINLMVDYIFAGRFSESVITYVNNAKNLVHFPQALIGVTISTVIFPIISKAQAKQDNKLFKQGIQQGINVMSLILLPAIAGMMWLMPSIVELLFQRGAFDSQASEATTVVAYFYVGSVIFFSLQQVLNKGFYALNKGRLILTIGLISIGLNALFNYIFTMLMGSYNGIPLASSVMAFVYFAVSLYIFRKLINESLMKEMLPDLLKIIISVILMMGALLLLDPVLSGWGPVVTIILTGLAGSIVYGIAVIVLKVSSIKVFTSKLARKS